MKEENGVIVFDTANVLFVCGGSFARGVADVSEPVNLVSQGMIRELIGRLSVIVRLADESESSLDRILLDPKNAVMKEYQERFDLLARPYCRHGQEPWCCTTGED